MSGIYNDFLVSSILFFSILSFSVLFNSIQFCSLLFSSLLFCSVLLYSPLSSAVLFYSFLFSAVPGDQGYSWTGSDPGGDRKTELVVYVLLPLASVLLLALALAGIYRRCSRSKLTLANVIALDLQDPEFLASLTRNAERHTSTSSDGSDGVFVMVYLPPPYEETLTKITRAASLSSSKDVESIKIEDLEAKLCPELGSGGRYV